MLLALFIVIVFLAPIGFPHIFAADGFEKSKSFFGRFFSGDFDGARIFGSRDGRNKVNDVPRFRLYDGVLAQDRSPLDSNNDAAVADQVRPDIVFQDFDLKHDFVVVAGTPSRPVKITQQARYAGGCVLILSNDLVVDVKGIEYFPEDRIRTVAI